MEKITYNLRYYRSKIVKEILKLINILSERKLRENTKIVCDFFNIMETHLNFDEINIIEKLAGSIESPYMIYLQQNVAELKDKIKAVRNSPWNEEKIEEIIELSSEHFSFCSLLDFGLSVLPYNIQDEIVEELKKRHKLLFEK